MRTTLDWHQVIRLLSHPTRAFGSRPTPVVVLAVAVIACDANRSSLVHHNYRVQAIDLADAAQIFDPFASPIRALCQHGATMFAR